MARERDNEWVSGETTMLLSRAVKSVSGHPVIRIYSSVVVLSGAVLPVAGA